MAKYLGPILTATVFFPLLAFLFTVPYMIYSYRKYGSVLITRAVLMYAFIYYLICVYALAIPAHAGELDSLQLCAGGHCQEHGL